jgi:hypothetical protein
MKKLYAIILAGLISLPAMALETSRLDSLGSAAYGATYVQILDFNDLLPFGALTNATVGITSAVPAKVGLTMAGMILETAFQDNANSGANQTTNSITLSVGDGTTATYYMSATEIAADGTEVFVQFAPLGAAITIQDLALTGTVQNVKVVTNVVTSLQGQKYYAAAGVKVYTFTTAGDTILGNMTAGRLKVYWRELK